MSLGELAKTGWIKEKARDWVRSYIKVNMVHPGDRPKVTKLLIEAFLRGFCIAGEDNPEFHLLIYVREIDSFALEWYKREGWTNWIKNAYMAGVNLVRNPSSEDYGR